MLKSANPGYRAGMSALRRPRRSVRLGLAVCLSAAFALVVVGCSSPTGGPSAAPTSPSPTPNAPPPTPTPALAIEGASATVSGPDADGYLYYDVRFLLRETTGLGSVTVQNVWPVSPDGIDEGYSYGPTCFHRTLRVPPGGTLDVFDTDTGLRSHGCQPRTWGRMAASHLDLVVTFRDDDGRDSQAKGVVDVER